MIRFNQGVDVMKKIKTSISIDQSVYDKIKAISEKEDRSFSQQVNKILKEYRDDEEV